MKGAEAGTRITLKNILYLTDFSEPSEAALPFAISIAREYRCKIYALHVLIPAMYAYTPLELTADAITAQDECAERDMLRVDAQLEGLPHETSVERGVAVWPTLERALTQSDIDLIVLGTHGRTGASKFLLGSIAEEIFRCSSVPVLTIGPSVRKGTHKGARFRRILFATDFTPESLAAAPYAISFAQENEAELLLLHVVPKSDLEKPDDGNTASATNTISKLGQLVPKDAQWCRPRTVVDYGNPADCILSVAKEHSTDLIVLGVRDAAKHLGAATHLERTTAHKVVVHAQCPVLTVRG
ncbi:MAG TPA: universal stress protein [Candidatus Acidoferrales bacterium]|nr:universal stress protein [Candidatus Acidoferrales bacterium]